MAIYRQGSEVTGHKIGGNQVDKIYRGTNLVWENWIYYATRTDIGYASCTFWVNANFEWWVPSNHRMVTVTAIAWVYQHVETSENQAVISTSLEGWNGSSWVLLDFRGNQGCSYKGETLYQTVTFTFNPYNTTYSKFKFSTGGNSFNRGITGYKDAWYQQG